VSGTLDQRAASSRAEARAAARAPGSRWHRPGGWTVLGIVAVLAAGAGAAWRAGAFAPAASSGTGTGAAAVATAAVTRQDLSATTPQAATLGYAGSYPVTGHGGGTLTWLPPAGRVIRQGQALYKTGNGSPVVLLYGRVPDWRALDEGVTGPDVAQLNHDLVALGYADRADVMALGWDYFSWPTAYAVQLLEEHLGVSYPPGRLALGQVVFEPRALRVSRLSRGLGSPADGPVLAATSARQVVTIRLSTSQEGEVAVGNAVTVTLPDGVSTPGRVASVGSVASGSVDNATIPVTVTLRHPSAAGGLDRAPVTVNITTASARNVLAVPVTALVAHSPGGYAVEVVAVRRSGRRWVAVRPGIFDDESGLVQVSGDLMPGQRVVVPAS